MFLSLNLFPKQINFMPKPNLQFEPQYFHRYINLVTINEIYDALKNDLFNSLERIKSIPEDKLNYFYENDKFTVAELLQHIIDTERIFSYRALCFARGEKSHLPGFDENVYAKNSNANKKSKTDLLEEYESVRNATISLYKNFDETDLNKFGTSNNYLVSLNALGFIIVGHCIHHFLILQKRYNV